MGAGSGGCSGGLLQAARPRISAAVTARIRNDEDIWTDMGILLLEALGALALLVFIVWWTMFSGRKGGERDDEDRPS
jgi:hypothetical protein